MFICRLVHRLLSQGFSCWISSACFSCCRSPPVVVVSLLLFPSSLSLILFARQPLKHPQQINIRAGTLSSINIRSRITSAQVPLLDHPQQNNIRAGTPFLIIRSRLTSAQAPLSLNHFLFFPALFPLRLPVLSFLVNLLDSGCCCPTSSSPPSASPSSGSRSSQSSICVVEIPATYTWLLYSS
jgi:hypothetical protein